MKGLNGARRCVVCNKLPAIIIESETQIGIIIPVAVVLGCHSQYAKGLTLKQAIFKWNHKIEAYWYAMGQRKPKSRDETPCWNCKVPTQSTHHALPSRYYTNCCKCGGIKSENEFHPTLS